MTARAESSIFWPEMTKDIAATRDRCTNCNGITPSQPAMPSTTPETPIYPFQHVCGNFFHHMGISYLVLVDRYSHWPIVTQSREGAKELIHTLRDTFATYGIPDSITSDGGPEFTSQITRTFLKDWNVHHRISSAYHPHANCRAEVGVKSTKRLIAGNTGPGGTLTDSFHKAMPTYLNNPDPETKLSPAMCVFGRPTRDLLPGNPAPPHLERHAKPQRESTVETIHSRKGQMGRAHSRTHATEGRRHCQDTKPDWMPPNQMGQDRDCCRGLTVPPVRGKDRWFQSLNYEEQAIPATAYTPPRTTHYLHPRHSPVRPQKLPQARRDP